MTSPNTLSDPDLVAEVKRLARAERTATAALVASLAELDARRLYLGEGCASMFVYCTRVLHLSEHAAYGRIEAARAARRFPIVLERLARGELTLTNVCLLRQHLTDANPVQLLDRACHAGKREVEALIASLAPRADAPAVVRKLPQRGERAAVPTTSGAPSTSPSSALFVCADDRADATNDGAAQPPRAPAAPPHTSPIAAAVIRPLAPERYKVQFTVSRETYDKLRRAQDLLRHAVPNGDPAEIVDRALTLLIAHLERTKLAQTRAPRAPRDVGESSRHIPASVRRAVWARDGGRCAFTGSEGRCDETGFLEFHHVVPFARGGPATAENVQIRCRAHNQYEAVEDFGARALFAREHAPAYAMNSVQTEHDSCAICARVNDAVGSPAGPEGSPSFPSQRNDDGPCVLCCGKRGVRTARFPRTLWAPLCASTGAAASTAAAAASLERPESKFLLGVVRRHFHPRQLRSLEMVEQQRELAIDDRFQPD
jgi:5-methylcytosine-specific restriction endonuclease McrA